MQINVTARHLKLTQAIRSYVEEKLQKAPKYFSRIVWIQVVLSVEKRTHKAEIVIHAPHQTFRAMGLGADLYSAVDLASDKIDAQLRKHKEKLGDQHHKAPAPPEAAPAGADAEIRFSVVKRVPLRPMSKEEAAREMEAVGYNFWMFLDRDSDRPHVIFRRLDDTYGLLQPVKWNGK